MTEREFGYPLMENHPSYAALFYAFISSRYEKKSTIITTNRSVTDWPRYLGNDKECCGAILDRFLHHSIRVCFNLNFPTKLTLKAYEG